MTKTKMKKIREQLIRKFDTDDETLYLSERHNKPITIDSCRVTLAV